MKILNQVIAPMYLWSIVLLILLAAISSIILREIPYSLIFAVLACMVIEMGIKAYHKNNQKVPWSGIITGLIIGSVAPIGVSLLPLLLSCVVAITSKFFIKIKGIHILNPANFGLLIGLGIFSIGSSWWAATYITLFGSAITLSIILIIATFLARRLAVSAAFIITLVILSLALSHQLSLMGLNIALLNINFFFAFMMLAEPKTSPANSTAQIAFGSSIAIIYTILATYGAHNLFLSQNPLFIALLAGNIMYAFYRISSHR